MRGSTNLGVIVTASLAGLLFGFDTVVISGVTESVGRVFHLDAGSFWYGFSVASALLGTFIGALVAGVPGDRYGSRDTLKAVGFMYVVSALGCAFCWNLESFYVFRFIGGLAIGASSVLAPVYISEIAPADRRGALTGLFQFNIVFGILLAYVSNFVVQEMGGADLWRLKFGIAAVPAILFAMLMYTIPQSPRWLSLRGRTAEAKERVAARWCAGSRCDARRIRARGRGGATQFRREVVRRRHTGGRSCSPSCWRCSTSSRASTPSSTTSTTSLRMRVSAAGRTRCRPWRSALRISSRR